MDYINVQVELTEDQYRRLLRIAAMDRQECESMYEECTRYSKEELISFALNNAVWGEIESGESYWGEYREDYGELIKEAEDEG